MKKSKQFINRAAKPLLIALMGSALLLCGCTGAPSTSAEASSEPAAPSQETSVTEAVSAAGMTDAAELFSDRDLDPSYDEAEAVTVELTGDTAACASDAVTVDGSTVTITDEGVYVLSGALSDGQVIVNAEDTDKVQLVLDGAEITSSTSAAIYSLSADKVFITLAEGSENSLSNGGQFVAIDDSNIDAAVFSKTDLTLNGSGSLTVSSPAGHGIVCKDELVLADGKYNVTASGQGISGQDSIAVAAGTFEIASGADGLRSENSDDTALGNIYIITGSFTITSQGDAISASGAVEITDGSYDLIAGGGSATVTLASDAMGGGRSQWNGTEIAESSTESYKGVKAGGTMKIAGGVFVTDTADDGLHSGGALEIETGEFNIKSGDDGIHSDADVTINGGSFSISYCYEGIEGTTVTVNDGTIDIVSSDDGVNAGGGTDASGTGGGWQDEFAAQSGVFVVINGGSITIVSDGDSIDSNGSITVNGGTLDLTCNGNGNTAIDSNGTYTNNGGSVTTNDGSESGTGGMGGGQGGMGGGTPPQGTGTPPQGTAAGAASGTAAAQG